MTDPCRPNPSSPRPRGDDVTWARSTFCGLSGGCVEVALDDGVVLVRDSKLGADSPVQEWTPGEWCDLLAAIKSGSNYFAAFSRRLRFDEDEWAAFTDGAKAGEFDLARLLPGFKTSSVGAGGAVGDGGTSPAAAVTGAGGGAVLPVPVAALECPTCESPEHLLHQAHEVDGVLHLVCGDAWHVAAQDLPEGSPAESPGCNPAPAGTGVLSLSAPPSPPTSQGTNLQRAHAIVLSQLRGRTSKIEQAEQIVAELHDAGLLVDEPPVDSDELLRRGDELLRRGAEPLVPVEPGSAPPDCACLGCLAWRRGIVS